MKKSYAYLAIGMAVCALCACANINEKQKDGAQNDEVVNNEAQKNEAEKMNAEKMNAEKMDAEEMDDEEMDAEEAATQVEPVICPEGLTLECRILPPKGYVRTECEEDSFAQFLRSFPMKEYGARVHLYDGSEKYNQSAHISVFDLPIENYDLQQCADSVIRMYAEYFYSTGQYDRIAFHYTNGFLAEYSKWRDGNRIRVEGNTVSWVASAEYDASYECFVKYLKRTICLHRSFTCW